jgi:hypothetical protein
MKIPKGVHPHTPPLASLERTRDDLEKRKDAASQAAYKAVSGQIERYKAACAAEDRGAE